MSTSATPRPSQSAGSPVKVQEEVSNEVAVVKKESFKWSTPADEFAEDVASDAEEDYDDDDGGGGGAGEQFITGDIGEYEAHQTSDGGIVIHMGVDTMFKKDTGGETNEAIQDFMDGYQKNRRKKKESKKQKFQCPKCSKIWNWPWELRRHVLTHYKEKERQETATYKCKECNRGFQWKRDLAQHMRLHTGEKLLVCSVCEKKFTTRQALLHHVVVHTGEKPFQCALCGNRFTQPANLRTHMKKKHDDVGIKGNKCPHCLESFQSIISVHQHILEDHQNIVAEEREVQTLEKMKKEQIKAEKERMKEENRKKRMEKKKTRMDFNDFRSAGLQEWEINYEFHIGEGLVRGVDWDRTPANGELNCDICDRKFGWRYEVMFHNLCHKTDELGNTKNRVCPECDTAFKVPIGLKHHLLLHTRELPFLCLHCWRSFSSHIDLKLHIRKEHMAHLQSPETQAASVKKTKPKTNSTVKKLSKKIKHEEEPQETPVEQLTVVQHDGENVQLMVANQETEPENQTILVNSDGTIVQTGDQDMIVVIQSEDFDQSQGLIVVDPDQLQQMVGSDGMPVTVMQAENGTMVLEQSRLPDQSDVDTKVIVSQGGNVEVTPTTTT